MTATATIEINEGRASILPRDRRNDETDDVQRLVEAVSIATKLGVPVTMRGDFRLRVEKIKEPTPEIRAEMEVLPAEKP